MQATTSVDANRVAQAEQLARAKISNPNGACVGFYYLLHRGAFERLHSWPNNFANWFRWLPDTAVIHAAQVLQDPTIRDFSLARSRLLQAANAGIPVYTDGLRVLYDNLSALVRGKKRAEDREAKEVLSRIENVAAAADWTQVRTTIYGRDSSLPWADAKKGKSINPSEFWFIKNSH
jgi:hypothetical protein